MRFAKKRQGRLVSAYELGAGSEMEARMIHAGRICRREDGGYALFSQEAVNGCGQRAEKGDFFKVDGSGYPYPNARAWFLANHRHMGGDNYEQIPRPLEIWMAADGENEVIRFLLEQGKLLVRKDDPARYFNAHLWGADLSAAQDAVVVFYGVKRNEAGAILDVEFNFVAREEFDRTYVLCSADGQE